MVEIKTEPELEKIREASKIVARTLALLRNEIRPGISTGELNRIAESRIRAEKAVPAFLGYRGYPATLCVSLNDEIVHGIPDEKRFISSGDIVSLDLGCIYRDYYGDAALTVAVGSVPAAALRLIKVTENALKEAIAVIGPGVKLGDVSGAVERFVEKNGMSVVREFTGHGIGRKLHEEPPIPNFGQPGTGLTLKAGMTLAVEPMVCLGKGDVKIKEDGWTAVSADGSCAAHFEHTVCVTDDGCEILSSI